MPSPMYGTNTGHSPSIFQEQTSKFYWAANTLPHFCSQPRTRSACNCIYFFWSLVVHTCRFFGRGLGFYTALFLELCNPQLAHRGFVLRRILVCPPVHCHHQVHWGFPSSGGILCWVFSSTLVFGCTIWEPCRMPSNLHITVYAPHVHGGARNPETTAVRATTWSMVLFRLLPRRLSFHGVHEMA